MYTANPSRFGRPLTWGEIDTWVLRLLAQVPDVPRDRVATLLTNTYAGYLATRASPEWEPEMRGRVEAFLTRALELGLLEQEGDIVRLSLLGKACGRSHLRLPSAMRLQCRSSVQCRQSR